MNYRTNCRSNNGGSSSGCPFGRKCHFGHSDFEEEKQEEECPFGERCSRRKMGGNQPQKNDGCLLSHGGIRNCIYGMECKNRQTCPDKHQFKKKGTEQNIRNKKCHFGAKCSRKDCFFKHPDGNKPCAEERRRNKAELLKQKRLRQEREDARQRQEERQRRREQDQKQKERQRRREQEREQEEVKKKVSDPYTILGLDTKTPLTIEIVKKAYRTLIIVWHPDKNPDRVSEATEKTKVIVEAYNKLKVLIS